MSTAIETKEAPTELEAQPWGNSTGKDLISGLDEFFEKGAKQIAPETKPDNFSQPKESKEPETKEPDSKSMETKEEPEKEVDEPEKVIDEEFFTDDEDKKDENKDDNFDESEFDKETEADSKGMEAKAGEKFKALRAELKEYKQKSKEAVVPEETQKKLADLELKAAELEGYKARFDEISSQSSKLQVENSPEYDQQILKPVGKIYEKLGELAESHSVETKVLAAIVRETNEKARAELVEDYLSEMPAYNQGRVIALADQFSDLMTKREEMLADADRTISAQQAKRVEEERAILDEQRRSVQTIQKDIFDKYKESIPGFMEDGKETDVFKQIYSKSLSIDLGKAKARDQAFAVFGASVVPHLAQEVRSLQKKLAAYENNDERSTKGAPKTSGSVKQSPAADGEAGKDFLKDFINADLA